MFVPLPNLDDRRWTDLVDEARSLIPVYAPGWTDFNESDPGITLMEVLAWIAESDIYRVNRISDAHKLAFFSLIGVAPEGPVPAFAPVQFALKSGPSLTLPVTTELNATMLDGKPGKFRLRSGITVLQATISQVRVLSGGKLRDVTGDWNHRVPIAILGTNPQPGDALYLGLSGELQAGDVLNLYIGLQGEKASGAERQRILEELASRAEACPVWIACGEPQPPSVSPVVPSHYSVTLVWESQTQPGVWETLSAADDTRSMSLSGIVTLTIATPPIAQPLSLIRCRFVSGAFDAAPVATAILENTAEAEQCSPITQQCVIAKGVTATGAPAEAGQPSLLDIAFDASGVITSLEFGGSMGSTIPINVLAYTPASTTAVGSLIVEASRVAIGTGAPNQLYQLNGPELISGSVAIYTIESGDVKEWSAVESFVVSSAADLHYVLDAEDAEILFGDGQNGRVPPAGATIVAVASTTSGAAGNVPSGAIQTLDTGSHNTALLDVATATAQLKSIANPDAATDGAEAETIEHCEGRAALLVDEPERAVTLSDCEALALETPGTSLSRAAAIVNYFPGMQCYSAPGMITVVIVPSLPLGRPVPSGGLISAVRTYLARRSVIGTRIEVIGPDYLEIAVTASLKAVTGQNKTTVHDAVVAALQAFLDPLAGGPDGMGWPLGRAVYVSEILDIIAQVAGVDHVVSLTLTAEGCGTQCGDICLNPLALTVSGTHEIQVN